MYTHMYINFLFVYISMYIATVGNVFLVVKIFLFLIVRKVYETLLCITHLNKSTT